MKAILIDDDPLALRYLENIILDISMEIGGLEIVGQYRNPLQALEAVQELNPDLIFLDIVLPHLNGLEVAKRFQACLPQVQIVFITSYNQYAYAVKAFEVDALDFILKPYRPQRLRKTFQKLRAQNRLRLSKPEPASGLLIRCFQSLQVDQLGERPYTLPLRWRTAKAQEIFAYLLYRHGQPIPKECLLQLFWPTTEPSKARSHLYSVIYHIQQGLQALGTEISLSRQEGAYQLDVQGARIDVEEWERLLQEVSTSQSVDKSKHSQLMGLYRGDYLACYNYTWAVAEQERLRKLWIEYMRRVAEQLLANKEYLEAIRLYQYQQVIHPDLEESYLQLMQLYSRLGDRQAVDQQYSLLQARLQQTGQHELLASAYTWYKQWQNSKYAGQA